MIDLRSDTVTQPTAEMKAAMMAAEVGDDVFGDDPTVNRLEALAAALTGKEAALFVSSGTQSNLIALMTHCQRGDEYIVGQDAHTYKYEAGGGAVLGGIQPQPIDFEPDGTLDLNKVKKVIKPDDYHFAKSRLLCLENTNHGKVLPMNYLKQAAQFAKKNNLNIHLDGARVCNASVKLNLPVSNIAQHFDSVSLCLSKGLGAPVGSVLCGPKDFIKQGRRWRKMLGGGMRQAGILAAAGIYALNNNVQRLEEDHRNAQLLAEKLNALDEFEVDTTYLHTNMVFGKMLRGDAEQLHQYLLQRDIKIIPSRPLRLVTHLAVSEKDVLTVISAIKGFFASA